MPWYFSGPPAIWLTNRYFQRFKHWRNAGFWISQSWGVAKSSWNLDQLRQRTRESLEHHGGVAPVGWERQSAQLKYVDGDYREASTYEALRRELGDAERPLHYLAIPTSMFATVAANLTTAGCTNNARAVEKPFGRDLATSQELDRTLHEHFSEDAIFRIDHYLGKETVQNLLYFRFANSYLEPIWNHEHIRSVKITMAEDFGVQGEGQILRGGGRDSRRRAEPPAAGYGSARHGPAG